MPFLVNPLGHPAAPGVLAVVRKRLQQASNTVDLAETRTRVLQRHLRDIGSPVANEPVPVEAAEELLD